MRRILLVDDHLEFLDIQRGLLEEAGYSVVTATNGFKALAAVETQTFDLVITDIIMPGKEGLETIMELRRRYPLLKIMAMSGGGMLGPCNYLELAAKFGAVHSLQKPFSPTTLLDAVATVLEA